LHFLDADIFGQFRRRILRGDLRRDLSEPFVHRESLLTSDSSDGGTWSSRSEFHEGGSAGRRCVFDRASLVQDLLRQFVWFSQLLATPPFLCNLGSQEHPASLRGYGLSGLLLALLRGRVSSSLSTSTSSGRPSANHSGVGRERPLFGAGRRP
jgi:hypothetical protein